MEPGIDRTRHPGEIHSAAWVHPVQDARKGWPPQSNPAPTVMAFTESRPAIPRQGLLRADSLANRIAVGFGDAHRSLGRGFHALQAGFLAGPENARVRRIIGITFRRLLSRGLEHDVHAAVVSQP